MALAICWLGALLSHLARCKRKRLLATQTGLDSLRAMTWREFEMPLAESTTPAEAGVVWRRGAAVQFIEAATLVPITAW
jgi:hypothetical protein